VGCRQASTCDIVGMRQKLFIVAVEAEALDTIHSCAGLSFGQKLMGLWEQLSGKGSCLTSD